MKSKTTIVKILHGSHLYGTNTETSDLDYKSVFLPSGRDILLGKYRTAKSESTGDAHQKNTKDDVDDCEYSLGRFLQLVSNGDTVCMDMLFAPLDFCEYWTPMWKSVLEQKKYIVSTNISAYMGYLQRQASKYGIKGSRVKSVKLMLEFLKTKDPEDKLADHRGHWVTLSQADEFWEHDDTCLSVCGRKQPWGNKVRDAFACYKRIDDQYGERARKAEMNEGVDWKAIHHATRAGFQIQELLTTGHITFPRPERELLLKIKKGLLSFDECSERLEQIVAEVERLRVTSTLLEKPNLEALEEFLIEQYKSQIFI